MIFQLTELHHALRSPNKKIKSVKISKSDDKIFIKFCSKSLQNQVRSMLDV